ncbi:MAG: hypothetical protein A3C22_00965 [Candidatus Levybacteria bacterium RIFCSPHIGHO2_02_FULL_37_10]|nr:MAG: hypothetical protein A3C22_00965 [Candidatus Levybacteria bacterium RIFCSPHIGHO2_02_FULL_37_10]OGH42563.1 MAG: hypothetical protein A3H79_03940 [Candidatus Levybacteria bacterium RIFCSPLOWO2_02_FULL_36_8b]
MTDPKTIVFGILDIIGYSEDKEKFATEFLQTVSLQALLDLFNTLPQDKKDQFQQKIQGIENDAVQMQEELKKYFTQNQIEQTIETSARNAVTEYIKTIEPTLSDPQKQNLTNYFSEITKNVSPAVA